MAISVVSFSFSRTAQPEARGPSSLGHVLIPASSHQLVWSPNSLRVPRAPFAGWWLSLPHLVSNSSNLQLTDFLSSPSYIIVQSPTQSLEWHVWSSSTGNNCHAVHRSLSSDASVYECTMGFYLIPFFQPSPPTRFLLITAIGMCHFLPVHHFGMACLAGLKVNIQHITTKVKANSLIQSLITFPMTITIVLSHPVTDYVPYDNNHCVKHTSIWDPFWEELLFWVNAATLISLEKNSSDTI